ncbi:hypothetical protein BD769DRAFT_1350422 [Suillus cothurnatus]|nr:hypothetical protein BD769DRAFT_1350422 [Suillus cothurnatus]
MGNHGHALLSCQGCSGSNETRVFFDTLPPLIVFEVVADSLPSILPSLTLTLPTYSDHGQYHLRGIIYQGEFHFSARMLQSDGIVWQYDDRLHNGTPSFDFAASEHVRTSATLDYHTLQTLEGRTAHLLIYMSC